MPLGSVRVGPDLWYACSMTFRRTLSIRHSAIRMLLGLVCVTAVASPPASGQAPAARVYDLPDEGLRAQIESYDTDYATIARFYPLRLAPVRNEKLEQFLDAWAAHLGSPDALTPESTSGVVDLLLLEGHVRYQQRLLERTVRERAQVAPLLPFVDDLTPLLSPADPLTPPMPAAEVADLLARLARQVSELQPRVHAGEPTTNSATEPATRPVTQPVTTTAVHALRAAGFVDELRRGLRRWYEDRAPFEPAFSWWNAEPYKKLNSSLEAYAKHLRESIAGVKGEDDDPLVGDPIGPEALLHDLDYEMIPYTPEQLIEIAQRELRWCRDELVKAANDMGHGDDWQAALAEVKSRHVPPGEQDELVIKQAREAIAFCDEHELVTIPQLCRDTWRLTMLSPQQQRVLPYAAYGGQEMLVAYAADAMEHGRKIESMRGNNQAFSRLVTPHELIPGHHLQGFMSQRHRPYRGVFRTPFYVEGWALHWEMVLWDMGYPRTPEQRIGMLFWRSHRAARILVSLKFHLGEMTPAEMVDFLVDEIGHERDGATAEVRRYINGSYSPLYQCAYMIGGLQLQSLYKQLVTEGEMSPRAFHDKVLTTGPIPMAMVRAQLLGLSQEEAAQPWYWEEGVGR